MILLLFVPVILILFCYFSDLLIFRVLKEREFRRAVKDESYIKKLESDYKKHKHPKKKNLLLYFLIEAFHESSQKKKAEELKPFLKEDSLMGICLENNKGAMF